MSLHSGVCWERSFPTFLSSCLLYFSQNLLLPTILYIYLLKYLLSVPFRMKARKIPYCGGSSTQHISFSPNPPSDTNNSWKSACVLSRCGFLPFSENVRLHDKALIPETETDSKILKPNLGLPKGEGWGEGWTGRVGMAYIHYWNPLVTRTCYIAWGKVFNTLWWPTWEKNLKKKEYIYIYTYIHVYVWMIHFAVHLKLPQHCKSPTLR